MSPSLAPAPELDLDLVRWDVPLLRDPAVQARVRAAGWTQLSPVLTDDDLAALRALADEFLARLDGPAGDLFLTVGRITDVVLRAEMIERAGAIVRPRLEPLFVDGAQFLCSAFQVKPPSPTSELNPHQDSSLVDERHFEAAVRRGMVMVSYDRRATPGVASAIDHVSVDNFAAAQLAAQHLIAKGHKRISFATAPATR